ncbi:MAG: penicillin-binding protein 2 [Anaerolineae bacterium]
MRRLNPFQGWRLTLFQGIVFAVFLLFSLRMYQLQLVDTATYQARANENRLSELPIAASRGTIVDRYGVNLAVNSPAYNVTIIPASLPDDEETVLSIYNRLSALTGVPPTAAIAAASGGNVRSIEQIVNEGEGIAPYRAVTIAEDVDHRVMLQILEEEVSLPGVAIVPVSVREYPTGELTSQIIGYMGRIPVDRELELIAQGYNPAYDRVGYAGLELYLENFLRGERGRQVQEVDVAGRPINQIVSIAPQPGLNVRLTIDTELQQAAEEALVREINLLNAQRGRIVSETGSVIAMNPMTGEILAMVSYPSYDNSRFARAIDVEYYGDVVTDPLRPLLNHATQTIYPPGSVWKLVTAWGVLEDGVISPSSTLNDPGELLLPNRYAPNDPAASQRFVCWLRSGHGRLNIIGAIAQSCDVFFYQVGGGNPEVSEQVLRPGGLGPDALFRYATSVGIGSTTGVELPLENSSRMPDPDWKRRLFGENWSTGDTYNAAFGQGYINVTPMQLITSTSSLINGGTVYQPTLIEEFTDSEGQVVRPFEPQITRTLNPSIVPETDPLVLEPVEDMIMRGPSSLACVCEADSQYYNANRCDPNGYRAQVDTNPDPFVSNMREYRVHVPLNYDFTSGICEEVRFNPDYQPAFATTENLTYIQQGMRQAVTLGTATRANLPYVAVAGKTGTAEYCDEIARPLGLCRPGNWPAHAWFTAYAPYDGTPEIIVQAFVYNGGEGSAVALPIVVQVLDAYYRLKNEREGQGVVPQALPTTAPANPSAILPNDSTTG